MNREDLIKKWLDYNLTAEEQKAFEQLEDYDAIVKISNFSDGFKAPEFNSEKTLQTILDKTQATKTPKPNWKYFATRAAAIIVVFFSAFYFYTTLDTNIQTDFAQKEEIVLPDNSNVTINAQSSLSFNKKQWNSKRTIKLKGEAFFKVAKGSTFNVITSKGKVTVLGTQFNVKQRLNYFEVTCYEGSVQVHYKENKTKLKAGESFLIMNEKQISRNPIASIAPNWIKNTSEFRSIPFKQVFLEFERQYNVVIETENIDVDQLFTGQFTHENIDIALQAITQPLALKHTINGNKIIIKRE